MQTMEITGLPSKLLLPLPLLLMTLLLWDLLCTKYFSVEGSSLDRQTEMISTNEAIQPSLFLPTLPRGKRQLPMEWSESSEEDMWIRRRQYYRQRRLQQLQWLQHFERKANLIRSFLVVLAKVKAANSNRQQTSGGGHNAPENSNSAVVGGRNERVESSIVVPPDPSGSKSNVAPASGGSNLLDLLGPFAMFMD